MADDKNTNGRKYISHHILPTASNLLGLCFVILSLIKVMHVNEETIIDELIAVAIIFFLVASILSYMSMRSENRYEKFEKAADLIFLAGLVVLAVIAIAIVFVLV